MDQTLQGGASVDLKEYIEVLRARKWLILAVLALVLAADLAFTFQQKPIYVSEAKVLATPTPVFSPTGPSEPTLNMANEEQIASSLEVASLAQKRLGGEESTKRLLGNLTVSTDMNSDILTIQFADRSPTQAQLGADAFASAYLQWRREAVVTDLAEARGTVSRQISLISQRLTAKEAKLATTVNPGTEATLKIAIGSLRQQVTGLQQVLFQLQPATNLNVGQIIEPAQIPSKPSSPKPVLNTAIGIIVGLALGAALAFVRERLDDRIKGRADLEEHAGAPVLAVVPRVGAWRKGQQAVVVTTSQPHSHASEAYRTLRTGLLFAASQRELKTVLITSAQPEEGKSATTANLAIVLAQAGRRVVVVSADLRKPRVHKFFGMQGARGLTNVLAGELTPDEALTPGGAGLDNLKMLPSGPVPGNPAELLGSEAMGDLLTYLKNTCDFVLIDAAPVLPVADAVILASRVDAVLLVVDANRSATGSLHNARQELDKVNAPVIGAVLNNFEPAKGRSYQHYRYYGTYRPGAPGGDGLTQKVRSGFGRNKVKS